MLFWISSIVLLIVAILFVLFPFWSTGALAGGVVGYMLGLRTWVVFLSVIAGNFLSVACWIWFFDSLNAFMKHVNAQLPVSLPLVILLTVIVLAGTYRAWRLRKRLLDRLVNGGNGAKKTGGATDMQD